MFPIFPIKRRKFFQPLISYYPSSSINGGSGNDIIISGNGQAGPQGVPGPAGPAGPQGVPGPAGPTQIASTTNLGVVQIGSGLSITSDGVLSAVGAIGYQVTLTSVNYTADADDYYIGGQANLITITLPLGILGKAYIVKNQVSGNITVECSGGQKLDNATSKSLGTNASIFVIFDGTRWNIIE